MDGAKYCWSICYIYKFVFLHDPKKACETASLLSICVSANTESLRPDKAGGRTERGRWIDFLGHKKTALKLTGIKKFRTSLSKEFNNTAYVMLVMVVQE